MRLIVHIDAHLAWPKDPWLLALAFKRILARQIDDNVINFGQQLEPDETELLGAEIQRLFREEL